MRLLRRLAIGVVAPARALRAVVPAPRKINVGVAVSPPNVVHTTPYVAKALGYFAKHCVDANIIQFDGGEVGTSVTAVAQGTAMAKLSESRSRRGSRPSRSGASRRARRRPTSVPGESRSPPISRASGSRPPAASAASTG